MNTNITWLTFSIVGLGLAACDVERGLETESSAAELSIAVSKPDPKIAHRTKIGEPVQVSRKVFEFEDLPLDARLFTNLDTRVTAIDGTVAHLSTGAFIQGNGVSTSSGFVQIGDNRRAGDRGYELQLNNVNVRFDFDDEYRNVAIKFAELGGNVNLTVNEDSITADDLAELDGTYIGKARIKILHSSVDQSSTLLIRGEISALAIGGQELFIDRLSLGTPAQAN